jgi:hypothetical protein
MSRNGRITDAERAVEEIRDIRKALWGAGRESPSELLRRLTAERQPNTTEARRAPRKGRQRPSKGRAPRSAER